MFYFFLHFVNELYTTLFCCNTKIEYWANIYETENVCEIHRDLVPQLKMIGNHRFRVKLISNNIRKNYCQNVILR